MRSDVTVWLERKRPYMGAKTYSGANFFALFFSFLTTALFGQNSVPSPGKTHFQRAVSEAEFSPLDAALCSSPIIFLQSASTLNAAPSQDFESTNNQFDVESAEDFNLSIASALSSISVIGMGSVAPDSFMVRIYRDASGLPGIQLYSELFVNPSFGLSPVFDLSACPVLDAGRYWVSVQAVANFGNYGQWYWTVASDGVGNSWAIRNPEQGFGLSCTSWGSGASCGFANGAGPGLAMTVHSCAANVLSSVGPNCRNVNASLDENGNTYFNLSDVVTNFPIAAPARVTITRSLGTPVFGPATVYTGLIVFNACHLINEVLTITVETEGGTCWSNLTFKQLSGPIIESRSYTLYCFDEATLAADLKNPPLAYIPCQTPFKANYVTDWLIPYDCEPGVQDTVKIILREWEAYDKKGKRGSAYDTIVVVQFGQIDEDHIYCQERDTLYCSDTTDKIGPYITYEDIDLTCDTLWLINTSDNNNDGILEFNPTVLNSKCGLNVFLSNYRLAGECGNIYRITVDIKQSCYGEIDENCNIDPPAGVVPNMAREISPGYWRCEFWLYDLDTIGPALYCKAVDLFSGPFSIDNWSVIANPHNQNTSGAFFDPLRTIDLKKLPYQLIINSHQNSIPLLLGLDENNVPKTFSHPEAFIQNAVLSFLAEEDMNFDFGWNFSLASFNNLIFQNQAFSEEHYASLSYYISINGVDYQVIEGNELNFAPDAKGGVLLNQSQDGLLSVPLKSGDLFSLHASWSSPVQATLTLYGPNIVSTSEHECVAHVYIPPLYAADDWGQVKQVKAIVESSGTFLLSYDKTDSCWVSHERIKLPMNGEHYKVIYEAYDGCHNLTRDSCVIYVKDRVKPVAIIDKSVTVTLSDQKVWLDYKSFDEGSWDNCSVNFILIRRTDWQESCIDLCDNVMPCYMNDHKDTIWIANLEKDKNIDAVEAHYAKTLEWLCQDDTPCGELLYNAWLYDLMKYATLNCNPHLAGANESYFKEKFYSAFHSSTTFRDKFADCQSKNANLNTAEKFSPFLPDYGNIVDLYEQLGGGWSDAVAFDCQDACSYVTVEMLVMDYWCNYTKIWNRVKVEDKTPVKVVKELSNDETISCKSYRDPKYSYQGEEQKVNLEFIVNQAKLADQAALDLLDEIFGGYQKAWLDPYGKYVDEEGKEINPSVHFVDSLSECKPEINKIYVYDEHLGYYWKDSIVNRCIYLADTTIFDHGILWVNCPESLQCKQEVWSELDHCGQGFLYRKFKIWQSCQDSFYVDENGVDNQSHTTDTLVRHQRIYIGKACLLDKSMFDIPGDLILETCGIEYDEKGQVVGEASPEQTGYPKYKYDDDCRLVGIGHSDQVFKIEGGREACYKIIRTWYFADWCGTGGVPVDKFWWQDDRLVMDSCVQKILVIDQSPPTCQILGPVRDGDSIEMGSCYYNLRVQVNATDLCGLTKYEWHIKNEAIGATLLQSGEGNLNTNEEEFVINAPHLSSGNYVLFVSLTDDCHNQTQCRYNFSIKSVKKPSPVCYSSLTIRLTPWDLDQDGKTDTSLAILWASEFDRSSTPMCGDDSLEFRVELLDGLDDETEAGEMDFIELGCDDVGTRLVRLWVISHPSKTVDYCDGVLIIQSDLAGCGSSISDRTGPLENLEVETSSANRHAYQAANGEFMDPIILSYRHNNIAISSTDEYNLEQNIPNPFQTETSIRFFLPETMMATLSIIDLHGRVVQNYSGQYTKGYNQISLKREELPTASMLFYKLEAGTFRQIKRMILIE